MIQATFYTENLTFRNPTKFENELSRQFQGWTHIFSTGWYQGAREQSQSYMVVFETYFDWQVDIKHLQEILKRELNQKSVLVTIQTVEVLP